MGARGTQDMATKVVALAVLLALSLAVVAAPTAVAEGDCVAYEKDGVWVYPEHCVQEEASDPRPSRLGS